MQPRVPVSVGELLDKLSILHIKKANIRDEAKLANVERERIALQKDVDGLGLDSAQLVDWDARLREVNGKLWDIEDRIRICESEQQFGDEFVQLARAVYKTNDVRAAIKREINEATGSELLEEKSYEEY
jgi:aryl carrier-like protein